MPARRAPGSMMYPLERERLCNVCREVVCIVVRGDMGLMANFQTSSIILILHKSIHISNLDFCRVWLHQITN